MRRWRGVDGGGGTRESSPRRCSLTTLEKLCSLGGAPLGDGKTDLDWIVVTFGAGARAVLAELLGIKNGFYAFEGALHVFPARTHGPHVGLAEWNAPALWRKAYQGMADGALFFAEDVFGVQFCVKDGRICTFDPETGDYEDLAPTMDGWATEMLSEYPVLTGHELARAWQERHGALPVGSRLVPVTPFTLGGEFSVSNVKAMEAVKAMNYRASIAVQLRDLPDGAKIQLRVVD